LGPTFVGESAKFFYQPAPKNLKGKFRLVLPEVNKTPLPPFQCRFQPDIFSLGKVQEVARYLAIGE